MESVQNREANSQDFFYIKHRFGFKKKEIIDWIDDLKTNRIDWYKRLVSECFTPSYEKHFKDVEQLKNTVKPTENEIVTKYIYMVDAALEEAYHSIKYITCALQMEVESKHGGKRFFELPNIGVVLVNERVVPLFVFMPI